MSSDLPKLFGRDFVVGYLLPVALGLVTIAALPSLFGFSVPWYGFTWWPQLRTNVTATLVIVGVAWVLVGVLLVVLNRPLLQLLEGYIPWIPGGWATRARKRDYDEKKRHADDLRAKRKALQEYGRELSPDLLGELAELRQNLAEQYPHGLEWILPTKLGNTMRAAESHAFVMYGLDTIVGWNRLLAVMPKDWREQVDGIKAEMDFWVNLWLFSVSLLIEWIVLSIAARTLKGWWAAVVDLIVLAGSWLMIRYAAEEWGDHIKASFDVFLPTLGKQVGLPPTPNREEERDLWLRYSQALQYRSPSLLPERIQQGEGSNKRDALTPAQINCQADQDDDIDDGE